MSNPYDSGYGEYGASNPYGDPHRSGASLDGLSIAALICSLTCCAAPVGIGLGIAGIVRTKGGRRTGRWAAITGLVIGVVLTLAMVAFFVFAVVVASRTVQEEDARIGQCVDIDFVDDLSKATCSEPHDAEVIWVGQFDDALLAEFDELTNSDFCSARDLTPEHSKAASGDDYSVEISIDSFDEDEPEDGDWFVCYVERRDGEQLEGRLTEPSGSSGA